MGRVQFSVGSLSEQFSVAVGSRSRSLSEQYSVAVSSLSFSPLSFIKRPHRFVKPVRPCFLVQLKLLDCFSIRYADFSVVYANFWAK